MDKAKGVSRRRFLFAAGAGGAAAAALVVTNQKHAGDAASPAKRAKAQTGGSGYQLTEHVRNYYRTTRV